MSNLDYIDKYFKKELTQEEATEFERKINDDPFFAEEVTFYWSAMQVASGQLIEEKKKKFRKIYDEKKMHRNAKPAAIKRSWIYITAAASIVGVIISWYLFIKPSAIQHLADKYIEQNFQYIGVKMSINEESVTKGISLYNENKLPDALWQFEMIIQSGDTTALPKKMAGIVSLRLGDYDKAIDYFTQLEKIKLYSNPGKFYHAIALIKRNRNGDKEMAKQLLRQVIEQDLEGKEIAERWLK